MFIALALSILFFLLSMPFAYIQSDKALASFKIRTTFDTRQGLPTTIGLLVHSGVFLVIACTILMFKLEAESSKLAQKSIDKPEGTIKV